MLALLTLPAPSLGQAAKEPANGGATESATANSGCRAPAAETPALPPKTGSHVPPDDNACIQCHGDADLWDLKDPQAKKRYIPQEELADDVHWKKGVNCSDCHGGNYKSTEVNEAHAKESGFRGGGEAAWKMCAFCHENQSLELVKSVHAKEGPKDEQGRSMPLECRQCHGASQHHILPVTDSRSPVFVDHQLQTCGQCHKEQLATYEQTSHYHGLKESGLLVTAVCANCHGAHGIYWAADRRSTLFTGNVAVTCGKCHRFIAERLRTSVHGQGAGTGRNGNQAGAGRQIEAASKLHLLPPRPRDRLGCLGAVPPADAEPLRQLPLRSSPPAMR